MSTKTLSQPIWYNRRLYTLGLAVVFALGAFGMASRALFTGSLQQYFLTFVLVVFTINRLVQTFRRSHGTRHD